MTKSETRSSRFSLIMPLCFVIRHSSIRFASRLFFLQHLGQVGQRPFGLRFGAAFDRQHALVSGLFQSLHDTMPIDLAIAARTADGRARDLAAFRGGLFARDVLGVHVDDAIDDGLEHGIGVFAGRDTCCRNRS